MNKAIILLSVSVVLSTFGILSTTKDIRAREVELQNKIKMLERQVAELQKFDEKQSEINHLVFKYLER